ncbi:FtsX-like permease family protein [Clostridium massiliamazoniense]|uniref:FtsX-like permease family protein n=1 Tax=Clostridium massiliamazoniense TaxID=1347366 RepID=UPI0006D77AD3|nr:ABC transporter permease [Clostridium massiliamazoniense]
MFKAIKRIKKIGAIGFLIIIQLSIGLTMVNTSGRLFEDSQNRKKGIESLFDINNTTMVRIGPIGGYEKNEEDIWSVILNALDGKDIYEELKRAGIIKDYYLYGSNVNIHGVFWDNIPKKYENVLEVDKGAYIGEVLINENFLNHYNFKISSGRNLKAEDFKKDYKKENIPILLGNEFEKTQKLGDTFKIKYISEAVRTGPFEVDKKQDFLTFEVVGFLERNAIPISNGPIELFAQNLLYSDGIKVIPSVENFIGYNAIGESVNAAIFLERGIGVKEDELVKILNEKLKKHNLYANLFSLSNTTTVIESYERDVKSSLALGFLLLVISIIGTSCIMLGQLNKRKREFGIKIAMGATLNEIAKEIFLEVLVMVIIASIISLILNIKVGVGLTLIGINLILVVIISFLIAIIPVREIKKMNIVELVKGN